MEDELATKTVSEGERYIAKDNRHRPHKQKSSWWETASAHSSLTANAFISFHNARNARCRQNGWMMKKIIIFSLLKNNII